MPLQKERQIEGVAELTWKQVLPELARLDDPATHELFSQAQEVSLPTLSASIFNHAGESVMCNVGGTK
jgi:hypothetical protein